MKKLIAIFAVCLSIGAGTSFAQSAKEVKSAKSTVVSTRSGATSGRILTEDEIANFERSISRGYACYVQDLYRHYELKREREKAEEWLAYGLEHEDMWSMCYMYAFRKNEMSRADAEELKKKITKHKEHEQVFYVSEIYGIEWDE